MASSPLVSVLIPLFDKERFVGAAVESALGQTHPNVEVLVLDDGSTDRSLDELARIDDQRLTVVSRPNRGANATRNELLAMARGDFVQFLDADDLLDPRKLEQQLAVYADDIDVVFCGYRTIDERGSETLVAGPDVEDLVRSLAAAEPATIHLPLNRRATLAEFGGFDPALRASQEYELHLRLATTGAWRKAVTLVDHLATYRIVDESVSSAECRVYSEKAKALRQLLSCELPERERDPLAEALMNAARHLARCGQADAADAYRFALAASARSTEALPRRQRPFASHSRALVRWERIESRLLSPLRGRR